MEAGESLRDWQRVYTRLAEFVEIAAQAGEAIEQGDAPLARALVHETRAVRAALIRASKYAESSPLPSCTEGVELVAKMQVVREQSMVADRIARAWIERELPDDETLATLEGGHLAIADRLLPPTWDVDIDLVALVGPGGAPLAKALVAFGQKRIVVYADGKLGEELEAEREAYPREALVIAERTGLKTLAYAQHAPERLVCHRSQPTLADDIYSSLCRDVEESFGAVILGRNTVAEFGQLWLEQGLANLASISRLPSIDHLSDRFSGIPMVIVAPGPSLTKNVAQLRELEGRAIIATFSHTLSALAAAGVRPNLVVAVDMEDLRYHFDNYPIEDVDALALGLTVHPDLYEIPSRHTFAFASNSHLDDWLCGALEDEMTLSSGGSVAHSAFSMARKLGCDPIILVGQDLSFPDGKVYCDTNVDGDTVVEVSEDGETLVVKGWSEGYANLESIGGRSQGAPEALLRVPGYHGGEVVTSAPFALFRRWFCDAAIHATADGVELLNCTEGGAAIDGWAQMPLAEAIANKLPAEPIDIGALFASAAGEVAPGDRLRRSRDHFGSIAEAIAESRGHAVNCIRAVKKLQRGSSKAGKLERAERKLLAALKPISFIAMAAQREIQRGEDEARDRADLAGNLEASLRLFETLIATCDQVEPHIQGALRRIDVALGEIDE